MPKRTPPSGLHPAEERLLRIQGYLVSAQQELEALYSECPNLPNLSPYILPVSWRITLQAQIAHLRGWLQGAQTTPHATPRVMPPPLPAQYRRRTDRAS